jgi:hypothetical protein
LVVFDALWLLCIFRTTFQSLHIFSPGRGFIFFGIGIRKVGYWVAIMPRCIFYGVSVI